MPNHLSSSASITSSHMLCYFLFWLIQFPFTLVSPQKIRWLFVATGIVVPVAWFSALIWSFVKVPTSETLLSQSSHLSGRALTWAWLRAMNTSIGANCSLIVDIMDFTVGFPPTQVFLRSFFSRDMRRPKRSKLQQFRTSARTDDSCSQYIQFLLVPLAHTFCAFVGIAVTSAGAVLYGDLLWDPLTLIDRWDNRPAAFFMSFAICLAAIGTNISANTVCAGNDMTALCPRVCTEVGLARILYLPGCSISTYGGVRSFAP